MNVGIHPSMTNPARADSGPEAAPPLSPAFRKLVSALWDRLGIGRPRFGTQAEILLLVDANRLTLRESPDGRCLDITAPGGQLSPGGAALVAQHRRLLEAGLALPLAHAVCLHPDGAGGLVCHARRPYARAGLEDLLALLDQVLSVSTFWQEQLAQSAGIPAAVAPLPGMAGAEPAAAVIFRP